MRTLTAVALLAFATAMPARAADFGGDASDYVVYGQRAGQIYVYDYEPGVRVRAYWASPWRNRRYFPTTGTIPEFGRDEDIDAPRGRYKPAENFYREWRTSSDFESAPVATRHAPADYALPQDGDETSVRRARPGIDRFESLPIDK